ncbi:MAG: phosphatidate cytidylyltransferase [Clostridia bacterium]|nr:phosphatidate cytidylyltransferase [Clostridia bacterium]
MKQRLISSFFAIILLILVVFSNQYVFDVAVVLISAMGIFEVITALGLSEYKIMTSISVLMPLAFMLISYFAWEYAFAAVFLFVAAYLLVMLFDHKRYSFTTAAMFMMISLMVTFAFIHVSLTRHLANGILNVFVIFIGSWITDTCAYFTGFAIGKHKLAPSVSPKKTIEGSIGGIVGVTVILAAYTAIMGNIMDSITVNVTSAICVGLICGVISQFGDLCASVIKRENNIKDFGKIMPGHGGVMDRFDSFIFVAPVVYYFLNSFPIFI